MSAGIVHGLRLIRVLWSLSRHGACFPYRVSAPRLVVRLRLVERPGDGASGERLATALQTLGPTFVKLGQSLVRGDLIGDDVADDLSALQDALPPFPQARPGDVERELDTAVDVLFTVFEETPAAAASIAQVHFAERYDGVLVAVKIRASVSRMLQSRHPVFLLDRGPHRAIFSAAHRLKPRDVVKISRRPSSGDGFAP